MALDQVLRLLQPDIRRYARKQCHRKSAIEDVVQEALIVLYRRIGNVRDPLAFAGWIFRMVTRLCMLPVLGLIRGAEELSERHEAAYFSRTPQDDLRIDLVRALESLPDFYRQAILLRDMDQLTIGEVAARLGITYFAISQQHSHPMAALAAPSLHSLPCEAARRAGRSDWPKPSSSGWRTGVGRARS